MPDGTVPKASDVLADPSLGADANSTSSNATAVADALAGWNSWVNLTDDTMAAAAANVFVAHKAAVEAGLLDFSESGYIRYRLGYDLNITDEADALTDNYDSWYYDSIYFDATEWRTIDKGLTSLPRAFGPLVMNRTMFQTAVREFSHSKLFF